MTLLRRYPAVARRLAVLAALALVGCGDDPVDLEPVTITVSPASITAIPGDTVRVRVTASGGAVGSLVLGASSGVARVDTSGLVTAVSPGTSTITATFDYNGQRVTGTIPITVLGLTLEPTQATIAAGATFFFRPVVIGDFSRFGGLRWSSSDSTVATVDPAGLVRGLRGGIARIAVFAANEPRLRAEATVTVASALPIVLSLTVSPTTVTLTTGATQQLAATVRLAPGAPPGTSSAVRFVSSDSTVAAVSPTGVVTAGRAGATVITVQAVAAPSVTQSVQVTVREPARGPAIGLRSITTGDPPVPVDQNAVRGTIALTISLHPDVMRTPSRVEVRLAGRTVAVQQLPAAAPGSTEFGTATVTVNTAARDAAGAPLYPNGSQTLELLVEFGCAAVTTPCTPQRAATSVSLTLANP